MGWTVGIPSLKLNNVGTKSKHCGNFQSVAEEALKERKGHDPDINPELSAKNIYTGYKSAADLLAYSSAHCAELTDAKGRALRKDAVRMCVTILKPPVAFMATLSEEEQKIFLQDGVEKLSEIIGSDNIRSTAWHFDEQGAHVHVFWEPMTKDRRLCAKEMHNLTFLGKLNREMPAYLRSRGWDIDDCNAYDAAEEALKTGKEKAERRHRNGRSSATYKAAAERELQLLNHAIDIKKAELSRNITDFASESIEAVVSAPNNAYENALFLLHECDDNRFKELSREGAELKRKLLYASLEQTQIRRNIDDLISDASQRSQNLTWQERQEYWDSYRALSTNFWQLRAEMDELNKQSLKNAYARRNDTLRSYYDALYILDRTEGILSALLYLVVLLMCFSAKSKLDADIQDLKEERRELQTNTATFKCYSNAYSSTLKQGKIPYYDYLTAMQYVIDTLDTEAERFRITSKHRMSR